MSATLKSTIDQAGRVQPGPMAVPVGRGNNLGHATVVAALSESDPADVWAPCTPLDATVLTPPPVAIFVGTGGNLNLQGADGTNTLFKNIPNGALLPLQPTRVMNTNTTALDIVLIYRSAP